MRLLQTFMLLGVVSCGLGDPKSSLSFIVPTDEAVRAEEVNFKVLQKKILPKCIGCHGKWTTEDSISRMISPGNPDTSAFYDSVKMGRMPKNSPPLSTAQLEIVRNYILNIKITPAPGPAPTPEPTAVAFKDVHEKVFKVSCLPCHGRVLNDEAILVSRWVNRERPELSAILEETESGRMPKDRPALTEEQVGLLRDYVRSISPRPTRRSSGPVFSRAGTHY